MIFYFIFFFENIDFIIEKFSWFLIIINLLELVFIRFN